MIPRISIARLPDFGNFQSFLRVSVPPWEVWLSLLLTHADFWFHGHAGPQTMICVFACFQNDANRHSLHYFYVVAGSILRRQQGEPGTGSAAERIDIAPVILSGSVGKDGNLLPRLHLPQLCLFKVSHNPDVIERNDGQ